MRRDVSIDPPVIDLPLPPLGCKSWSAYRKAAVVVAVRIGELSRTEAHERYMLSDEELASWETAFEQDGIAGLQVRHLYPTRSR